MNRNLRRLMRRAARGFTLIEMLVVIAIIAGADLAYVVSHHLLRMILVILLGPVVGKLVGRREKRRVTRR